MTAGHSALWPMAAILLLVVLAPTACMLWFLAAAMSNAGLAARQRLTDVYRQHVLDVRATMARHGSRQISVLEEANSLPPPQRFGRLATAGEFDGAVVRGSTAPAAYPAAPVAPGPPGETADWRAALTLEFADGDANAAAATYGRIAQAAGGPDLRARALQAQARCLAKAGLKDRAIEILTGGLASEELAAAADAEGRLIAPAAALLALELIAEPNRPEFPRIAEHLRGRLEDYGEPVVPAGQRLFLMLELQRLATGPPLPTQAAELCTAEYQAATGPPADAHVWSRAAAPGLWHMASADGRAVVICRQESLIGRSEATWLADGRLPGVTVRLYPPGDRRGPADALLSVAAPEPFIGWELRAQLQGTDPFSAAATRQKAAYAWTATLGVAIILAAGAAVAGYLGRQMRLARLKNDLIATVSHELKTPLASMRVLIDTLVDGRCRDERQVGEYYRLIARENERLSRLIDNFLTFSRMERKKVPFNFARVQVADVVAAAVESVRERFAAPGCRLDVDLAPDLPAVRADRDALVTVLLNLLDNAWKYSGEDKHITVRAGAAGGWVSLEVSDNGIGLSRRAARRVFDRFYQVDQRLSRRAGGCGLGLSIVRFIVEAHGGAVEVASRPGAGSTFTVRLPAAGGQVTSGTGT